MRKTGKSILSVFVAICLIVTVMIPAYAVKTEQKYPFIFVHGMCGWGEDSPTEDVINYWGYIGKTDAIEHLRKEGYEVYYPSLCSLSSNWDRCCELYAQLTGTRVDYGEAHSAKYGHERFGRDYTGKPIMGKAWDSESKLNLVGHSLGGTTIRMFTWLLAYGDETELAVSGENASPLFKGGHDDVINSVVTLSAPHNGSVVANTVTELYFPAVLLCFLENFLAGTGFRWSDALLDQWGISSDPASGERPKIDFLQCMKVISSMDHCGYDLSMGGAKEFNEKYRCVPNTYYVSYAARGTYDHRNLDNVPIKTMFPLFYLTLPLFKTFEGKTVDGVKLDETWTPNDGIVPVKSALYPLNETPHDFYTAETIEKGQWYVMPLLDNIDHFDYCRATGGFGNQENYYNFYDSLVYMVDTLDV